MAFVPAHAPVQAERLRGVADAATREAETLAASVAAYEQRNPEAAAKAVTEPNDANAHAEPATAPK